MNSSIEVLIPTLPRDLQIYIYSFLIKNFRKIKKILDNIFLPHFGQCNEILNLATFTISLRTNYRIILPKNFVQDCTLFRMNCCTIYPEKYFIMDGLDNDNPPKVILSVFSIKFNKTGNSYVPCLIIYSNGNKETLLIPYF